MTPILELRNVSKVFGGGFLSKKSTVAVDDISLTITSEVPAMTAVAGESGSGKTTLSRLLLGVTTPSSGQVLYKGNDLAKLKGRHRRQFLLDVQPISAVPFYLMSVLLLYIFAFQWPIFPLFGGFDTQRIPNLSFDFALNIAYHSILPALSIVLAQIGFWAMSMRSMMVTIQGEDYMLQAEAKGLKDNRIFYRYAMRNAFLPQLTGLALSLGTIISGAVLVEVVFSYPGVGSLLLKAVRGFDWYVIQGIVFLVILSVAFTMLVIDLVYPLLDPRINYRSE